MNALKQTLVRSWSLAIVVTILDQIVKSIVAGWVGPEASSHSSWIVGDWLGLAYAENRGVAFGMLSGESTLALLAAAIVILIAVSAFAGSHRENLWVALGSGLVMGGAIGNVIDRARFGYVRDFFAVGPWPSFNVADSGVTCGVLLVFLGMTLAPAKNTEQRGRTRAVQQRVMESSE